MDRVAQLADRMAVDWLQQYGPLYEDLMGLKGVPKRAAFVIAADGTVVYSWVTEDPRVRVPFDEVKAALAG